MIFRKFKFSKRISLILIVAFLIFAITITRNSNLLNVFSQTKELPIYSVQRNDKKVSVTIDAAWGDEFTEDILNILDEYKVKATFFLVGFWVDKYPHQVEEIHRRGHEIGNHSTTHPHMANLSRDQIIEELTITNQKIYQITKVKPQVFRPPYGEYNDQVIQTAKELDYYTIQWDIDSLDWKELGTEPVIDKVLKGTSDGSIILFHNNAKYIKEYLPVILQRLQEKDFEIVPVSQLIYKDNFRMDNTGRQIHIE